MKFHVYARPGSAVWWLWYWSEDGRQIRISTASFITGPLSRDEYTQEEVQKKINDATGVKTQFESHGKLSVSWVFEYMQDRITAEGKKPATWDHYRSSLLMFKEIYGESYSFLKFRSRDVWDFQRACLSRGKSPVTVNTYCRGMGAIFHRLLKSGLVQENPFAEFERLRESEKKRHLTKEELARFLEQVDKMKNRDVARLLYILTFTGMRRSEVLNIRRDDVDLPGNRFMVANIKARDGRKRWLSIPQRVRGHFSYFLEHEGDTPFNICRPDSLGRAARVCMKATGLPYHTHSLRHTFATLALLTGTPIRAVQRILDHSDRKITELYAHDSSDFYEVPDIEI